MKQYIKYDEWQIIEEGFHPEYNRISESIFSLGNGLMGQRGNFEEKYSGDSLQGNYIAGVYYPDKTKVGWWKNGYPEYFAKVLNAPNWNGIDIKIGNEEFDLATCEIQSFVRSLNMKEGCLERSVLSKLPSGKTLQVDAKRFISYDNNEVAAIKYSILPFNFKGEIELNLYIDADIKNEDSNYNEKFWMGVHEESLDSEAYLLVETKKTAFWVGIGMKYSIFINNREVFPEITTTAKVKYVSNTIKIKVNKGDEITIYKYIAVLSSVNHPKNDLFKNIKKETKLAIETGFDQLLLNHINAWEKKWNECDIVIEGDVKAQQGIRFNIFQLYQTYSGKDERFNIGPKGFTGEKYGGSTYWDTEAYCLPFYLATAGQQVARNLLVYRYRHLNKAIENAQKLGFQNGAALYPMVTMNGEECHNEWEITFEEIHRNGAIAFAIYKYINYTGEKRYLIHHGLEVLIAISRFWSQRVNFSGVKDKFVILGVTGPNEYENNANNNWYTNKIAEWTLRFTLEALDYVSETDKEAYSRILKKCHFKVKFETSRWKEIIGKMYLPVDEQTGVFLQQEGYMDKEQLTAQDIDSSDLPINQHWSWDRILRSCFIKQADVLQGLYFFENEYNIETIRKNFDFYEPRTVHESSLSPCVHSIIASLLGYEQMAYEFYLRTSRLDLDDYNNDTEDGCHITSMAGTWMSIVEGFAGMRVKNGILHFNPFIPSKWKSYSFKIRFRKKLIQVKVTRSYTEIYNLSELPLKLVVSNKDLGVKSNDKVVVKTGN